MNKNSGLRIKKNKNKNSKKIAIAIIIALILAIGSFAVWKIFFSAKKDPLVSQSATPAVDEREVTQKDKEEHSVAAENPRYISVPSMGITNARIVQIGLIGETKQLDSPISIFDAGWYEKSAKPGVGAGALLLDGHNGGPNTAGIFENLGGLSAGTEIIIERGDGAKYTYKVVENNKMTIDEANDKNNAKGMSVMTKSIDASKQGLNIITCVGKWVPEKKTYDQRILLRAVLSG